MPKMLENFTILNDTHLILIRTAYFLQGNFNFDGKKNKNAISKLNLIQRQVLTFSNYTAFYLPFFFKDIIF